VVVVIGRRDTGKSFLVRDLLYHHQSIPAGLVMSCTEAANHFFSELVPKMFIYEEYDSSLIFKTLARQKKAVQKYTREMKDGGTQFDPRTFVILDDCLYDDSWSRDKLMRCIFMNGRHWKIMLIITMQYPLGVPPVLRTNIDYTFILREPNGSNRRKIWEHYASMFTDFQMFERVMVTCTENFECLVVNNNSKSNRLQDQVFWYKALPRPEFRLGSAELWEMSKKMESMNEEEEENEFNSYNSTSARGATGRAAMASVTIKKI
jgi:hypothetical protein